jgi:hypothetical protein
MKDRISIRQLNSLVVATGLLTGLLFGQQARAASAPPENVLPSNAILHAQINSVLDIVYQVESLAKNAIPEKLAPPPVSEMLQQEHPLLAMAGMQMQGAPLDPQAFGQQVGLDVGAPVTVSVYPGDPIKFFILSLGISNEEALTQFLTSDQGPLKGTPISIGGQDMVQLRVGNGPLKRVFGLVHEDRIYLSGEPSLLLLLKDTGGYTRLSEDPHMADVMTKVNDLDVFVSVHPGLAKPLFSQISFFKYLPISILSQQKEALLKQIGENERQVIDAQIRMQLPVSGLDELLDYAECVVSAVYQSAVDSLLSGATSFEGVTLGIRAKSETPGLTMMVHRGEMNQANVTRPIPKDELQDALAHFPGDVNQWSATGRHPANLPSVWIKGVMDKMHHLMEAKGLRTEWLEKIQQIHANQARLQPMESQSDWTLNVGAKVKEMPSPGQYDSLQDFFMDWVEQQHQPAYRQVTVIPNQGPHLLSEHLVQQKHVLEQNQEQIKELLQPMQRQGGWIEQLYRVDANRRGPNVSEFTWENIWKTKSGLFGFNEHELIHRKIYLARKVDPFLVYHQDSGDHAWLEDFEWKTEGHLPESTQTLLNMVPGGSHDIQFVKLNGALATLVHGLADFESLAHRDIQNYLDQVAEQLSSVDKSDQDAVKTALYRVPFSPMLASVNQNPESGDVYGLLPGNIAFPRPKLAPILQELIKDYEAQANDVGGIITYAKHHDTTCEFGIIHHTGGLTSLLKIVGNTLANQYLKNPEGMQTLMQRAMSPLDMSPDKNNQILAKNPRWLFLDNIQRGRQTMSTQSAGPKVKASPQQSIPDRDATTPEECIDLGSYYNAALNDAFHLGGLDGNNLAGFPRGTQSFGGITFDARGLIHLSGKQVRAISSLDYPAAVTDILVGKKASQLHFLHGAGWQADQGKTIGQWIIYYNDGTESVVPIRYGIEVSDWWTLPDAAPLEGSDIAWEGDNDASRDSNMKLRVYKTTWNNPHPEKTISALDFRSTMTDSSPYLIAITMEP